MLFNTVMKKSEKLENPFILELWTVIQKLYTSKTFFCSFKIEESFLKIFKKNFLRISSLKKGILSTSILFLRKFYIFKYESFKNLILLKLYDLVLYAKLLININHVEFFFFEKVYRHKKKKKKKLSKLFTLIDMTY